MNKIIPALPAASLFARQWPGLLLWALGWVCMLLLDGRLGLSSLAMLLVLTAALAAVWLRLQWSLLLGLMAVLAFNWLFVEPRGTFAIDLQQDAILLLVMLAVSVLVATLMSALRDYALQVERQALAITDLRDFGEVLRDADSALDCLPQLQQLLMDATATDVTILALKEALPAEDDMTQVVLLPATLLPNETDKRTEREQLSGLWHCLRSGHALGPGSGRYQTLVDRYLPLRGRHAHYGAVLLHGNNGVSSESFNSEAMMQAQALCDQLGTALERQHWQQQQELSGQRAKELTLRATLLTAIAHDYRTPLATILGAASTLNEQDDRLNHHQRQQLAQRIVDESTRLRQLTNNILQLARLDAHGVQLQCDWQSAEELVGSVVQRFSQAQRIKLALAPHLPLLWCDALLVSQLLDNLLENACKYSPAASPIQISVRSEARAVLLAVRDAGPGIPEALQQIIFQPFRQGEALALGVDAARRAGVGLGLALCRSVASVHGGELRLHSSPRGTCFEFLLPHKPQPVPPAAIASHSENGN